MDKVMYSAEDISEDLSISSDEAEELLKGLAGRMERAGHLVIRGMVPRAYYERQKKAGFLLDEPAEPADRIPLNEKRLLCLKEFCLYSGLGRDAAYQFGEKAGITKRNGRKVLFDRVLFDRWCDENRGGEL